MSLSQRRVENCVETRYDSADKRKALRCGQATALRKAFTVGHARGEEYSSMYAHQVQDMHRLRAVVKNHEHGSS